MASHAPRFARPRWRARVDTAVTMIVYVEYDVVR